MVYRRGDTNYQRPYKPRLKLKLQPYKGIYTREVDTMNEIKRILMNRDDLTSSEADRELSMMREDFYSIAENGGSIEDVEELLYGEGLELDYIFDLL